MSFIVPGIVPGAAAAILAVLSASLGLLGAPGQAAAQHVDGVTTRIVNGQPARPGAFPGTAALLENGSLLCGSTIIGKSWVLTAAHCVVRGGGQTVVAAATLSVQDGGEALGAGRRIAVQQVIPHPQYDPGKMKNDIALLRLAQPSIRPRQLLASAAVAPQLLAQGASATVVGWGEMVAKSTSNTLLQASLPVVSLALCREVYREPYEIHDSNICAGGEAKGSDSCQGDSGGPLYVALPVGGAVQVGIVSWGIGCRREGKYGVYTSVAAFEPFIRQYVPDASFATEAKPSGPGPLAEVAAAQPAALPSPGVVRQVSVDVTPTGPIRIGGSITITVRSTDAGTLLLYSKDADDHMFQLFPNKFAANDPSAFTTGRTIKPNVTAAIPGPADGFTITASPPAGDISIIAIVAPPGARLADLIARYIDLQEIPDAKAFFAELASRLREARLIERNFKPQIKEGEQGEQSIAMAQRQVKITP